MSSICKITRIFGWREDNWEFWKRSKHDVVIVNVKQSIEVEGWKIEWMRLELYLFEWGMKIEIETEKVDCIQTRKWNIGHGRVFVVEGNQK